MKAELGLVAIGTKILVKTTTCTKAAAQRHHAMLATRPGAARKLGTLVRLQNDPVDRVIWPIAAESERQRLSE